MYAYVLVRSLTHSSYLTCAHKHNTNCTQALAPPSRKDPMTVPPAAIPSPPLFPPLYKRMNHLMKMHTVFSYPSLPPNPRTLFFRLPYFLKYSVSKSLRSGFAISLGFQSFISCSFVCLIHANLHFLSVESAVFSEPLSRFPFASSCVCVEGLNLACEKPTLLDHSRTKFICVLI